ncbi:hypothetical protein QUA30_13705 [Microcoleus sp. Pol14C2]|uniref:hypothetical protein n=1 Tax=unclassified Microcoleus TaxID=2642155 RepID=UPI002FD1A60B
MTLDEDSVVTTGCSDDTGVVNPVSSGALALFSLSEVTAALSVTGEVSSTETDGFSIAAANSSELVEVTSVSVLAGSDVAGAVTTGVSDFDTSEAIASELLLVTTPESGLFAGLLDAIASELAEVTSVSVLAGSDVAGAVVRTGVSDFDTSEVIAPELLLVTTPESGFLGVEVSDTIAPSSPVTLAEDSVVTTGFSDDTGVVDPVSSGAIATFSVEVMETSGVLD